MKRRFVAGVLFLSIVALLAARPSLEDQQAQIDGLQAQADSLQSQIITARTEAFSTRSVVWQPSTADTSLSKTVTATCPAGKVVFGGGGHITFAPGSGSVGQTLSNSYPASDSSWTVSARSPATASGDWTLNAYAICAVKL